MSGVCNIIRTVSLLMAAVIFHGGCVHFDNHDTILHSHNSAQHFIKNLKTDYPERFQMIHRAVLDYRGESHVFNGYLTVDRETENLVLAVQGELGGTIFKIVIKKDEPLITESMVKGLNKKWLEKAFVDVLKTIYFKPKFKTPLLTSSNHSLFKVIQNRKKNEYEERLYISLPHVHGYRLTAIRQLKNNRCWCSIDYHFSRGSTSLYPESFTIINKKMRYRLDIQVTYVK